MKNDLPQKRSRKLMTLDEIVTVGTSKEESGKKLKEFEGIEGLNDENQISGRTRTNVSNTQAYQLGTSVFCL